MTFAESSTTAPRLSGEDVLWSACYLGGSECTLPGRLLPYFPIEIRDASFDVPGVANALTEFARSAPEADDDRGRAVALLARAEASRMAQTLAESANRAVIEEHADIDSGIERAFTTTAEFLTSYGLDIGSPVLRLVDTFPEPYQERQYAMLTADAGDWQKYGVEPGVYLRRSSVRPLYSEALVCHELLHVALGEKHPDLMGRGLEEGIAELLGSIMLSCRQVGETPTYWIEVFNRNNHVYDAFWEHYNDFLRMAYLLYRRLGVDELMGIVAEGRGRIKEVERDLVSGARSPLPRASAPVRFDAECDRVAERLVMSFPRSMTVGPVTRVVADHARIGATAREIAAATGLSDTSVDDALHELTESAVVTGLRADGIVVTASDLDLYLPAGMLRYTL